MQTGTRYWTNADPSAARRYQTDWTQARHDADQRGGWIGPGRFHPDRIGRVPMIIAMVLGFILFWPIGLAILGYLWWSGKMGCFGRRAQATAGAGSDWDSPRGASPWASWFGCRTDAQAPSSGNRAFDEYRSDTLRRLEDEQKEFAAYLDRLRFAKDKAEFDQFMAERWQRPTPPADPHSGQTGDNAPPSRD